MTPPRWAERLLVRLLPKRDQETVAGDVLEEYRDAIEAGTGRLRADCWYVRQILSVLSIHILTARHLLLTMCLMAIVAAVHLAYVAHAPEAKPLATAFAAHCAVTIAILTRPRPPSLIIVIGAVVIVWGGTVALAEVVSIHFDVKLALTGIVFIFQGVLTLALRLGFFGGFPSQGV
jgi:hypothetical protein